MKNLYSALLKLYAVYLCLLCFPSIFLFLLNTIGNSPHDWKIYLTLLPPITFYFNIRLIKMFNETKYINFQHVIVNILICLVSFEPFTFKMNETTDYLFGDTYRLTALIFFGMGAVISLIESIRHLTKTCS